MFLSMNDSWLLNVKTVFIHIKSNIQCTEISPSGAICHSLLNLLVHYINNI